MPRDIERRMLQIHNILQSHQKDINDIAKKYL
jgi:hypothetical protein